MREFAKVGTGFWASQPILSMSDDGKLLALYLITSPHHNAAGTYRCPDGYVMADLGWSPQRVSKGFAELTEKGFATRCETTFWVFIHKHFKHNAVENPNQAKNVLRLLEEVPPSASIITLIQEAIERFAERFPDGWAERLLNGLANPFETEREREREEREGEVEGVGKPPPAPYQRIVDLYHENLPTLRRVEIMSNPRRDLIRSRWLQLWEERGKRGKPNASADLVERFGAIFAGVRESKFLMGQVPGSNGRGPFKCSIDFLLDGNNFVKLIEGGWHDEAA